MMNIVMYKSFRFSTDRWSEMLDYAIDSNDVSTVRSFLELGISVNYKDDYKRTPLHGAIVNDKNKEIINMLVDYGADVNAVDYEGNTPLHFACKHSKLDGRPIIKMLLKNGANVNMRNNAGESALFHALSIQSNVMMIDNFLKYNANLDDPKVRKQITHVLHYGSGDLDNYNFQQLMLTAERYSDIKLPYFQRMIPVVHNRELLEYLLHYWIKLAAANLPLDDEYRGYISGDKYKEYYNECLQEIEMLKSTLIDGRHSMYDFLHMLRCDYINEELLQRQIGLVKFASKFTKYSVLLLARYHETRLFKKRKEVSVAMSEIFFKMYDVSVDNIVEKIVNYMRDEDLYVTVSSDKKYFQYALDSCENFDCVKEHPLDFDLGTCCDEIMNDIKNLKI